jgi:hypothetical protein
MSYDFQYSPVSFLKRFDKRVFQIPLLYSFRNEASQRASDSFMISHENYARKCMVKGDAPIPPLRWCRRPRGGAPAAASIPVFPETELAPQCPGEALRRGVLPIFSIYKFSCFWCEPDRFMCLSPEQK